ncbi:MAG: hypothetical protein LBO75_04830 [Bifidobacteriaceae bacterium]|nr:hypothetical protein [Bifidobacteriaceae bacterium]
MVARQSEPEGRRSRVITGMAVVRVLSWFSLAGCVVMTVVTALSARRSGADTVIYLSLSVALAISLMALEQDKKK